MQLQKVIRDFATIYQIDFGSQAGQLPLIPKVGREGIRTLIDSLSKNLSAGERIATLPPYQFLNETHNSFNLKHSQSYSFTESIELFNMIKYWNHAVIRRDFTTKYILYWSI